MKRLFTFSFILLFGFSQVGAQNDTLLWEDFGTENDTLTYIIPGFFGDEQASDEWLNVDLDGVQDANDRPMEWYRSIGFHGDDTNTVVMASSSWLQGFDPSCENWLITPRIWIADTTAELTYKSAPFQLPRYMDGYQVLVSTSTNLDVDFTDTIAKFAEFDGDATTDIEDTSTYVFSEGIMHTNMIVDTADPSRNNGLLQEWNFSLSEYAGQNIYIAFRHRSRDDNLISIDDVLVTGTGSVGFDELEGNYNLEIMPNPVRNMALVNYYLPVTSPVITQLFDINGKLIEERQRGIQITGNHQLRYDVSDLPAGTYFFTITVKDRSMTEKIVVTD